MSGRKLALLVVGLTFGAVLVALLTIDLNVAKEPLERWLVRSAAQRGVRIAISDFNLSFKQIHASKVEIFAPVNRRFFLMGEVSDALLTPVWWPLNPLRPRLSAAAKVYEGAAIAKSTVHILDDTVVADVSVQGARLALHPQLAGFGITDGEFSTEIEGLSVFKGQVRGGKGSLSIRKGSKPRESLVSLALLGLPFSTTIPAITNLDARVEFEMHEHSINVPKAELTSSLGKVTAPGSVRLNVNGRPDRLSFDVNVGLSPEGKRAIGPYLPMVSGGRLNETSDSIQIRIRGNPDSPEVRVY